MPAVPTFRKDAMMTSKRPVIGTIAAIVLAIAISIGALSASAGNNRATHSVGPKLVGSWMVSVNRGPALPPLKSLQTYTKGGGVIEIANGGATVRSPSHGAWERIGGQTYGSTSVFFRYDPVSGAYLGTLKLRHELEIAPDGQSFTGVAVGELRDANGNLLPGSNTRKDIVTAERINVEPVPNIP
jgi:hypothetical protein